MPEIIIPFYNEEEGIGEITRALLAQRDTGFNVLFVDNASTDNSAAIVHASKKPGWRYIYEPKPGKMSAVKAGLAVTHDRRAPRVAIMDADSTVEEGWTESVNQAAERNPRASYIYGPFVYTGFEHLPIFQGAYKAYNAVQTQLMENVGWIATGTNSVFSTDVLHSITEKLDGGIPEEDAKICYAALRLYGYPEFNPIPVHSSGDRIIQSRANFQKWCFYDDSYYSNHWGSSENNQEEGEVVDLNPKDITKFFEQRALKITTRTIMPMLIYEQGNNIINKLQEFLGIELKQSDLDTYRMLDLINVLWDLEQYEALISIIKANAMTKDIADKIAKRMKEEYEKQQSENTLH